MDCRAECLLKAQSGTETGILTEGTEGTGERKVTEGTERTGNLNLDLRNRADRRAGC